MYLNPDVNIPAVNIPAVTTQRRRNWSMTKSVEDADFVNTFQTKRATCQGS
ncbi:MAG: hypothetical protein WCF23_09635 [Candidatus Nitrosopolaris sp.]